jgi:hypothetical protein
MPTGAGETAAPAHYLPARLAGARRLEHGRATGRSTGGRWPGSTRTGDGVAGAGNGGGGAAGAGVSGEGAAGAGHAGGEAVRAAVAVEKEWGKRKKLTSGSHKKVYKITQMRYVQALSCHASTGNGVCLSEIVLVGLNQTINAHWKEFA